MFIGVDIGGTNLKFGVVNAKGELVDHYSIPTDAQRGPDAMIADVLTHIKELLAKHPQTQAIGCGVPGVVRPDNGNVYHPPNLPGWTIVPLHKILNEHCDRPAFVDNDANVAALAELELGAGSNTLNFLYVTLGTGIGGAIIYDGKLVRGEMGGAGEIGHVVIDANAPAESGMRPFRIGVLEEYVGRKGIITMARSYAAQHPDSMLHRYSDLDIKDISHCVAKSDRAALECFWRAGMLLGIGLASVFAILDVRIAVVSGGISMAHPLLLETAAQTLRERAIPTIASDAEIRRAHFRSDSGVIGAAILAKTELAAASLST